MEKLIVENAELPQLYQKEGNWKYKFKDGNKDIEFVIGEINSFTKDKAIKIAEKLEFVYYLEEIKERKRKECIPSLEDFIPEYFRMKKDELKDGNIRNSGYERIKRYIKPLIKEIGDLKLFEINEEKIKDYRRIRLNQKSGKYLINKDNATFIQPSTVNSEIYQLSNVLEYALLKEYISRNPVRNIKNIPVNNFRDRILTKEEEDLLLAASPNHLKLIIRFSLLTMMRIGEVLTLRYENIDFNSKTALILEENNKSKRDKKIPLNNKAMDLLNNLKKGKSNSEIIFTNKLGKPYKGANAIKNCFNNSLKRAGIMPLWLHDLRRTAASREYEKGTDIRFISKLLGHKDIETTKRYLHISDEAIRDTLDDY